MRLVPQCAGGRAPYLATLVVAIASCVPAFGADPQQAQPDILAYISAGWQTLTRSPRRCETVTDPKLPEHSVLYFPAGMERPFALEKLEKQCPGVQVRTLPARIERLGDLDPSALPAQGLLYLEHDYVVPGGRFNEMYGWDSYFIVRGLLREGKVELAQGMVENFFFEVEHYGAVLNANRTYYLTRSQPPFLTSMILAVYQAEKARGRGDLRWLERSYGYASRDYSLWTTEAHRAGDTGLARYLDLGEGPVPEEGDPATYYGDRVRYFLRHPEGNGRYLVDADARPGPQASTGPLFAVSLCPASSDGEANRDCQTIRTVALSADFYKGDRSMRESGFDISFRFGPFSGATHRYAPVCLNSLLYKTEKDLEKMARLLGRRQDAARWRTRAALRRRNIQKYLWDPGRGLFFDYDVSSKKRSTYEFATTYYPLWAGLASSQQARTLAGNLALFEAAGGLAMSRHESKTQWDYPYGWAPIHLLAVEGLRNYGYHEPANRISRKFLSMVQENFRRDGNIREKYNVVTRSSQTDIEVGYKENVVGFGWTNGVFLELLHGLPEAVRRELGTQEPDAPR